VRELGKELFLAGEVFNSIERCLVEKWASAICYQISYMMGIGDLDQEEFGRRNKNQIVARLDVSGRGRARVLI
jgi:hypothetical protein